MAANDMTFLHMSDTHIEQEGIHYWDVLDGYAETMRVFEHLREYGIQPDFIVISGDLIQGRENDDFEAYKRFKEVINMFQAEFGVPILLALGNGDVTGAFRSVILGETNADSEKPYYFSQVINNLKIIVLDTHIAAHTGAIDPEQLEWLGQELATAPELDHLLVMHHMPAKVVMGADLHELRNADALEAVIAGHNIIGILGGHVHMSFMSQFAGIPCAMARGICNTSIWAYNKDKAHLLVGPGYNLVHIRDHKMMVQFIDLPGDRRTIKFVDGW